MSVLYIACTVVYEILLLIALLKLFACNRFDTMGSFEKVKWVTLNFLILSLWGQGSWYATKFIFEGVFQ